MLRPRAAVVAMVAACLAAAAPQAAKPDDLDRLSEIADEDFHPIDRPLERPPFVHTKVLSITPDSLTGGWVRNHQCHRHFSVTPSLDIVFPSGKIRDIVIRDTEHLDAVEVRGHTVQLAGVTAQSTLCFDSENRVLQREADGSYRLTAGPFYYRFLDGYFPMDVDVTVRYPALLLEAVRVIPGDRQGVTVTRRQGEIRLYSRFEGTLWVHVILKPK